MPKVSATFSAAPLKRLALDAYELGAVVLRPSPDGGWEVGVTREEGGEFEPRFYARATEIRTFADLILRNVT